jgi:hypothetical protein
MDHIRICPVPSVQLSLRSLQNTLCHAEDTGHLRNALASYLVHVCPKNTLVGLQGRNRVHYPRLPCLSSMFAVCPDVPEDQVVPLRWRYEC